MLNLFQHLFEIDTESPLRQGSERARQVQDCYKDDKHASSRVISDAISSATEIASSILVNEFARREPGNDWVVWFFSESKAGGIILY